MSRSATTIRARARATLTFAAAATALLVIAAPAEARADDSPPASSGDEGFGGFHLAADAQTSFPLDVSLRVQGEAPFGLRLSTSVGVLPGPYVDAINAFLVEVNAYDQNTADLVKTALEASLTWRTHLGYRPFADRGFYFEAGYGLVALGGGASAGELVAGVTGKELPPNQSRLNFDVQSTLHMADVEIGWEWTVFEHLHIRAAIGGAFTFAAKTTVKNDAGASGRAIESFEEGSASYLDSLYTSYVFTPVATLGIGGQAF
ncbi:MAG: hypothetical protein R3B70_19065 [Polyangiaceae bacterium]